MPQEFYQEDEAEAILRIASQDSSFGGMPRERLLANAAELGISPEAVEEAEQLYRQQKETLDLRAKFERHQRQEYRGHLVAYVVVNFFLFLMNMLTSPHEIWFIFPLLGWGIGLAVHTLHTFAGGESGERDFEKWAWGQKGLPEGPLSAGELRRISRQDRHRHLHFGVSVGETRRRD